MTADTSRTALTDLIGRAQQLADAGQAQEAANLYRGWLAAGAQPLAYAAHFNLGVLLSGLGDAPGAEQAYREAVALQPSFAQGWLALADLLERSGRTDEALGCFERVPALTAEPGHHVAALNGMARLLAGMGRLPEAEAMYRSSLSRDAAQPEVLQELLHLLRTEYASGLKAARPAPQPDNAARPLVSILIPTHNRPDYAELALLSVLAQTYENIEIIISDNSDNELTQQRFAPYVSTQPCIRYLRAPGLPPMGNFHNCYSKTRGDLVNFLMDDDLFHPEKIERMAVHFQNPKLGLVTSFRQQIDAEGRRLAPTSVTTQRLMETASLVSGPTMFRHIMLSGLNVVGEPTTVLFRKSMHAETFGVYCGREYRIGPDMAAWVDILRHNDCVYLPEPLSYFRMHGNQDQRNPVTQARGAIDDLRLLCDSCRHAREPLAGDDWKALLAARLARLVNHIPGFAPFLVKGGVNPEEVHSVVRDATDLLLAP